VMDRRLQHFPWVASTSVSHLAILAVGSTFSVRSILDPIFRFQRQVCNTVENEKSD
jgi:hypothetical protein